MSLSTTRRLDHHPQPPPRRDPHPHPRRVHRRGGGGRRAASPGVPARVRALGVHLGGLELAGVGARGLGGALGAVRVGGVRPLALPSAVMKRLFLVMLVLGIGVSGEAREGFGFKKKAVDIQRTIPPATNAGARRVGLKVESERGADQDDARTLERYVSEHILNGGGTVADTKPEVTLDVVIDR